MRSPDGGHQVRDQRQLQHLLDGDVDDRRPPAPDRLELALRHALVGARLGLKAA
jgi:hypothetical protein